jgi:hypothetical protein
MGDAGFMVCANCAARWMPESDINRRSHPDFFCLRATLSGSESGRWPASGEIRCSAPGHGQCRRSAELERADARVVSSSLSKLLVRSASQSPFLGFSDRLPNRQHLYYYPVIPIGGIGRDGML